MKPVSCGSCGSEITRPPFVQTALGPRKRGPVIRSRVESFKYRCQCTQDTLRIHHWVNNQVMGYSWQYFFCLILSCTVYFMCNNQLRIWPVTWVQTKEESKDIVGDLQREMYRQLLVWNIWRLVGTAGVSRRTLSCPQGIRSPKMHFVMAAESRHNTDPNSLPPSTHETLTVGLGC